MTDHRDENAVPTVQITEEFLCSGASPRNGFTHEQLGLLGVALPLSKGWRRRIIGQTIDVERAHKFVKLGQAGHNTTTKLVEPTIPRAGARTFWLYVLELANDNFYVGIARNVEARFKKHESGVAAQWTALHKPLRVQRCADTGLTSESDAACIESALTIQMMEQHGRERVRGGQYCDLDQAAVDKALHSQKQWGRVARAALNRCAYEVKDSWQVALDNILVLAVRYYQSSTSVSRTELFSALYGLTRYRFWQSGFDAGLDGAFWDEKGILPVLLSFQGNRPLASKCQDPFCVLAGAITRERRNGPPFHHLFLLGWTAFVPSATALQAEKVETWLRGLPAERDRRYDEFTVILFPQMRYLLRA